MNRKKTDESCPELQNCKHINITILFRLLTLRYVTYVSVGFGVKIAKANFDGGVWHKQILNAGKKFATSILNFIVQVREFRNLQNDAKHGIVIAY